MSSSTLPNEGLLNVVVGLLGTRSEVAELPPGVPLPWYAYVPTKHACVIFVILFALSTLLHLGQAVKYRMWFLLPTAVVCGLAETCGWIGRLWSSSDIYLKTPFMIQVSTTVIAPTFLLASIFIVFGRIVHLQGQCYSRLRPKLYAIIFLTFDIISLLIQGLGGAMASAANNSVDADKGANIMLIGIILHLCIICIFTALATEFLLRYKGDKPFANRARTEKHPFDRKTKVLVCAMINAIFFLFTRAVYRTVELSEGFSGEIAKVEVYFNVFDAAMIVVATWTFNIIHPGIFLRPPSFRQKLAADNTVESAGSSSFHI